MSSALDQLPGYLRRYLSRFGWSREEAESWLRKPVSALGQRSVLDAWLAGDRDGVNNVVLRVGDSLGITADFDDTGPE